MEQKLHEELSLIKSMIARVEVKIDALDSIPKRVRMLEQFKAKITVVGTIVFVLFGSIFTYFKI